MKAFVKVEYPSEGLSPLVEKIFAENGFLRSKSNLIFETEAQDEDSLRERLERLHMGLHGSGIRYTASSDRLEEGPRPSGPGYREEVMRWGESGIEVDTLLELLDKDVYEFKEAALRSMSALVDKVAAERMEDTQERKGGRIREAEKEIMTLLWTSGPHTFHQLHESVDIHEEDLTRVLQEMVDEGLLAAEQRGHSVVYVPHAPLRKVH